MAGVGKDGLSNKLEVYDTENDEWEEKADAPTKREHLTASSFVIGGGKNHGLSVSGSNEILTVR